LVSFTIAPVALIDRTTFAESGARNILMVGWRVVATPTRSALKLGRVTKDCGVLDQRKRDTIKEQEEEKLSRLRMLAFRDVLLDATEAIRGVDKASRELSLAHCLVLQMLPVLQALSMAIMPRHRFMDRRKIVVGGTDWD
jgi:hypothetical protein